MWLRNEPETDCRTLCAQCFEDGGGGDKKSGKSPSSKPRSCVPDFVNAAFGVRVEATSTCGRVEREFCATKPGSKNEGRKRRRRSSGEFPYL